MQMCPFNINSDLTFSLTCSADYQFHISCIIKLERSIIKISNSGGLMEMNLDGT